MTDVSTIRQSLDNAREHLLAQRCADGHWRGGLSSSALATATAVFALAAVDRQAHADLIARGLQWLREHQNLDGGWGDTPDSPSNISTTLLAWSALALSEDNQSAQRAESYIRSVASTLEADDIVSAVERAYGGDRTFSAPILTMCAMAGRLGPSDRAWRRIAPLPFELAAMPRAWLKWLHLPVVSYALPALIAIGIAIEHHRPACPPMRMLRRWVRPSALRKLQEIQPSNGGFLEAAPLTSFVVMSLAAAGLTDHPVAARGVEFLRRGVRADGSWPIDTDLAIWVTTLSINAFSRDPKGSAECGKDSAQGVAILENRCSPNVLEWLLAQQSKRAHPYTGAAPGGWAWTDLPGAVCDADDTAGALLALADLGADATSRVLPAARAGVKWLLDLQNADGGIPTFCRGWGKLPFDRSTPDLTAHALRAWSAWAGDLAGDANLSSALRCGTAAALEYLSHSQRPDGCWVPLWFGNQYATNHENPTYGTSRVVLALVEMRQSPRQGLMEEPQVHAVEPMLQRGIEWLLAAQNSDGSWGGAAGVPGSIEETAVAVEALASSPFNLQSAICNLQSSPAALRGAAWLVERTQGGRHFPPAPIGLYFARLWYYERLYTVIFMVAAMGRLARAMER